MKWKGWIEGVLLVMMLFGTLGCSKKRGPVTGGMVDGPDMMYTPEDQSPFAGKWQSRDGSIVMEVESSDPLESSRIQVFVDGAACSEEDVSFSPEPKTPPSKEWSCPAYCPECGLRLK